MKKFLLPSIIMALPLSVWGFDVYLYKDASTTPIKTVTNAKQIIFNADGSTIVDENNASTVVPLADADFLSFKASSGVGSIVASKAAVNIADGVLSVSGAEGLQTIEVFAANGVQVLNFASEGSEASVDLSGLAKGLYMVRVVCINSATVKKIQL